jgi:hypothetical protein
MLRGVSTYCCTCEENVIDLLTSVYALYERTLRIKTILVGLLLAEIGVMFSIGIYTMLAIDFSPSCLAKSTPVLVLPMWYVHLSTNFLNSEKPYSITSAGFQLPCNA